VKYDFAIVGGGIVGLSTAVALTGRSPRSSLLVLEKEDDWARHQTGHNSGVIHSGIYYQPGSLKAKLCREGNRSMIEFCRRHGIEHDVCGKIIVATEAWELPLLEDLNRRALANGLDVRKLAPAEMRDIEPHVRGLAALLVPSTGIVDFKAVAAAFVRIARERGADLRLGLEVTKIIPAADGIIIEAGSQTFTAGRMINCAGLYSDRIARLTGAKPQARIVPFRGEYWRLTPEKSHLVKNLIYPVPNPGFPFLGVHFTRAIGGEVHAGPNAVLAFKREGYKKSDFNLRDTLEILGYPGFWRLAGKNLIYGLGELARSLSKQVFLRSLQRLIPEIRSEDILPTAAGVRAQALLRDGTPLQDFMIVNDGNIIHVLNAPSPAATAAIEIGDHVATAIMEQSPPSV